MYYILYYTECYIVSLCLLEMKINNRIKQIGITAGTAQVQKTVLLGTIRILRKVFEIKGYWL